MREHFHNPLIPHSHIVPHGFCRMNPLPVFIGDSEPLTIKLYDARHCNNFLEMKKKCLIIFCPYSLRRISIYQSNKATKLASMLTRAD